MNTATSSDDPPPPSTQDLAGWFETPLGTYLLEREACFFDDTVADIFGFNALQIGLPGHDFLRASRMPFRYSMGLQPPASIIADCRLLPVAGQSLDLAALPHVLEFSAHPHQILREVERCLMPEGSLVISGFNPLSLWGLTRLIQGDGAGFPWCGRFIHLPRIKDWLALLGLEVVAGRMCCYAPPVNRDRWISRFRFLDPAGDRWWAMGGGVYFLHAVKRVHGMRLLRPEWSGAARARAAMARPARPTATLPHRENGHG